jgi:hypothetical protein
MKGKFIIWGDLEHDGDGLVRLHFEAQSENFRGITSAWANEEEVFALASSLNSFPLSTPAEVRYEFGTPRSGQCGLRFTTVDNLGHCAAWIQLTSEKMSSTSSEVESSVVRVQFTAAAMDKFCAELKRFRTGIRNEATLSEHAL